MRLRTEIVVLNVEAFFLIINGVGLITDFIVALALSAPRILAIRCATLIR